MSGLKPDTVELWPGGPRASLRGDGGGAFADSVLLADFAAARAGRARRCADLGSGCGTLALALAALLPEAAVSGLELRGPAVDAARDLARESGLESRVAFYAGDLRERHPAFPPEGFDLVGMNPPYFAPGRGAVSPDPERTAVRQALSGEVRQWIAAGSRLLRPGGRLFLVHRAERLPELLRAMEDAGVAPKWLRCVHHAPGYPARLILAGGQKQAGPGLAVEAPLYLKTPDGVDSAEVRRIYRGPAPDGARNGEKA